MASGFSSTIYFANKNGTAKQYKVTITVSESIDKINIRNYVTISAKIQPNGSTWQGAAKTMEILWNDGVVGSTSLTSLLSGQSHTATGSFYVYHNGTSGAASGTIKVKIHSGSTYSTSPQNSTVSAGTATLTTIAITALPTSSLTLSGVGTTQVTATATAAGTVAYVKKNASSTLSQLMSSYSDLPLMVMSDGSVWARVLNHDVRAGAILWTSSEALNTQQTYKYSRLNILGDNLKNSSGKFEFLLRYPTNSTTAYNRWRQNTAPQNTTITRTTNGSAAPGYEAVSISWSGAYWGGLEYCSEGYTFLDGSTGHGNWWYAVAPYQAYQNGLPGPNPDISYRQTELWVRIPGVTGSTVSVSANTAATITGLTPETEYVFCAQTSNGAGMGYSSVVSATTLVDQASGYVYKDGAWKKGKIFVRYNNTWTKVKKAYGRKDGSWAQSK